jgi:3-oxoacyl-[acyl-carrier-protein] synthase-3
LDTSDEWLSTRTVSTAARLYRGNHLRLGDGSRKRALENAGTAPEDLDLIICSTLRGDYFTPSLACIVQMNLGATCPAFDINAACSGFLYALDTAAGVFARGRANKILVIAAEAMSTLVDWTDRSTCVLFGDGSGAAYWKRR